MFFKNSVLIKTFVTLKLFYKPSNEMTGVVFIPIGTFLPIECLKSVSSLKVKEVNSLTQYSKEVDGGVLEQGTLATN